MLEEGVNRVEQSKRRYVKSDPLNEDTRCCFTSKKSLEDSKLFCCRCAHKRKASPLTCLAVCFLVLTYNLLGGFLFLALEGGQTQNEETAVAASKPNLSHSQGVSQLLRSKTVEKLWSITEDLNILYKENWTKLAAKELMDFQKVLIRSIKGGVTHDNQAMRYDGESGYRWTFTSSFLYALTLITTIGHGSVTPQSSAGKLVAVAYACVGIPVIMLYLSTIGDALARNFRSLYSKICPSSIRSGDFHSKSDCLSRYTPEFQQYLDCDKPEDIYERQKRTPFQAALNLDSFSVGYHWTCRDHTRVPIFLSFFIIIIYLGIGTLVFHKTEKWSLMDGCYFSFSTLATIGLGDLKPGLYASTISPKAEDIAVGVCCIYILFGIVVIAMCFNLIQEDLGMALRSFTMLCTGGPKSRVIHMEKPCEERMAMSVVS